jgi:hypothetical protein
VRALDLKLSAAVLFIIVIALQFCTIAAFFTDSSNPVFYVVFGTAFLVSIAMIIFQRKIFSGKAGAGAIIGSIFLALFYKATELISLYLLMKFWETFRFDDGFWGTIYSDFGMLEPGSLSVIGIIVFLIGYIIVKIITKKDGVIRFTAADAVAVFIGTTPFLFFYIASLLFMLFLVFL